MKKNSDKMITVVFAAHPDDAEIGMAGTIAKMVAEGAEVIICDLTRGELGTRGNRQSRDSEAAKSAEILGIKERINLDLPDGGLKVCDEYVSKVVEVIRKYKPKVIFTVYFKDRHPDHIAAGEIIKRAYFFSGVAKYKSKYEHFRPSKLFYYPLAYEFEPSFIVDISEFMERKISAIKAFSTQFYNPANGEPETLIASKMFLEYLTARARMAGFKIRREFGEAFITEEYVELNIASIFEQGGL